MTAENGPKHKGEPAKWAWLTSANAKEVKEIGPSGGVTAPSGDGRHRAAK